MTRLRIVRIIQNKSRTIQRLAALIALYIAVSSLVLCVRVLDLFSDGFFMFSVKIIPSIAIAACSALILYGVCMSIAFHEITDNRTSVVLMVALAAVTVLAFIALPAAIPYFLVPVIISVIIRSIDKPYVY